MKHPNGHTKTIISWHLVLMMLRNGKNADEVAEVFHLQRNTLHCRAKEARASGELPLRDYMDYKSMTGMDRRKRRTISWTYVFKLLNEGNSIAFIAEHLDLARETLKKRAREDLSPEDFELYGKLVMKNRFSHKVAECGTVRGYWMHRHNEQSPIDRACLDAYNEYNREKWPEREARRQARLADENKLESEEES